MAFASRPDARISFTVHEPAQPVSDPETLLLIMGLTGSGRMWWRLVPSFSRRHRVIVFDNRGTGDSSPARRRLTMADMVGDTVAVLDSAEVDRAHVLGASMGGMIAQHLALDHRDRIASLMLACTTAGGHPAAPNARLLTAALLRPVLGPKRTFSLVAPALYSPRTLDGAPDRVEEDLRRRASDRVGGLTAWAQMSAIAGHNTRSRLSELADLPTLVIHGTDDRIVPLEQGRDLAQRIPGASFVEVRGAGHLLATDAEADVVSAVLTHVERHTAVTR
ncbi:MAG TPA: alpha/beta fold hydrolase [Solirubrobacteraceae bacterium]|jgi:pimeloyl-ACP methyl ester carboxylesterase|nr:alpha/beta fold hydrolase [Solirubrobacteraceae bacterium]